MNHLLTTTIAAVLLVGCGNSQPPEPPTAKAPDISIHEAANSGNIETVKQHMAAGADVNAKREEEWTPLHYAACFGHKEIAELLIAKGADVNAKEEEEGMTPLIVAVGEGYKKIIELLIANGADVNAQSDMGTTLHLAVGFGHNEIAKLLIAKGANINTIDVDGETAIDRAVSEGKKEIVDLLREHGGKTWKELEAEGK